VKQVVFVFAEKSTQLEENGKKKVVQNMPMLFGTNGS